MFWEDEEDEWVSASPFSKPGGISAMEALPGVAERCVESPAIPQTVVRLEKVARSCRLDGVMFSVFAVARGERI